MKKAPFNIWDSEILNHEYEYSQIIIFDLHKEIDYMQSTFQGKIRICLRKNNECYERTSLDGFINIERIQ